jgi:hypothetical protein
VATATVDELTFVSFPIVKWDKTDDGDLIVYGKATDGSLDSDDQVVDPSWSAKALSDWHGKSGGNVRVQHQALRDPAGRSISIEVDKDGDTGHWVKSLIVEPVAKRLVEKGVLTAYSVGIARPVIKRDPTGKARGGIVAGGHLAEISLVDRPANKACGFVLGKSDKNGDLELTGEFTGDEEFLAKFAADEDLLVKQGSGDAGGDPDASADESDGSEAAPADSSSDPGGGSVGSDEGEGSGYSDGDEDDGDADAVSKADGATRLAYRAARAQWLAGEPSIKGIAGGTEYLAKRADWMRWHANGEADGLTGTREAAEMWLAKRDFSADQRRDAASSGAAMSDGSFPVKNGEDLGNAIHLAGHAKNPGAARAHIRRRAAALGMSSRIPDTWDKAEDAPADSPLEDVVTADVAKSMLGDDRYAELAKAGDTTPAGKPCPTCKGDGKIMGNQRDCPDCNGTGKMTAKAGVGSGEVGDSGLAAGVDKGADLSGAGDTNLAVGTVVETEVGGSDPAAGTVTKGTKDCKGCGKSYDADTSFNYCQNCGKKLPSAKKSAKARARAERDTAIGNLAITVLKSVKAGLITAEAGDEIIAQAVAAGQVRKDRQVPADVAQAKPHREPDGTSTVEQLEPQAGMATDPDRTADRVPSSVGGLGTSKRPPVDANTEGRPASNQGKADGGDVPYNVGRMHDLMCAAYNPAETLASYPSLKSVADAVDDAWFLEQAAAAMTAGDVAKAMRLGTLTETARAIKQADPGALADASALLHKAFTDMYPDLHINPQSGIRPGTYQRPYLTMGHAAETASDNGSTNIPPSAHTPEPEDFQRPLITDGHEADSPANRGNKADGPPGEGAMATTADFQTSTGAARTYYSNAQRDAARAALQSMHDHIAGAFPDLCSMSSSKSVMPPDMGANDTPKPTNPAQQGGLNVGKAIVTGDTGPVVTDGPAIQQAIADAIRRHTARGTGMPMPGLTRKQISKAAKQYGLELVERKDVPAETGALSPRPGPAGISLAEMKALLAEQITPLVERTETEMNDLRKQIDEIGARPDPMMAPVRGALAKAPSDVATPVDRRSLVDEANDRANKSAVAYESNYRSYVEALSKSPDPGVREAALATLDKLSAG